MKKLCKFSLDNLSYKVGGSLLRYCLKIMLLWEVYNREYVYSVMEKWWVVFTIRYYTVKHCLDSLHLGRFLSRSPTLLQRRQDEDREKVGRQLEILSNTIKFVAKLAVVYVHSRANTGLICIHVIAIFISRDWGERGQKNDAELPDGLTKVERGAKILMF